LKRGLKFPTNYFASDVQIPTQKHRNMKKQGNITTPKLNTTDKINTNDKIKSQRQVISK
jgi:exopolysaccharide biosynthesis protein